MLGSGRDRGQALKTDMVVDGTLPGRARPATPAFFDLGVRLTIDGVEHTGRKHQAGDGLINANIRARRKHQQGQRRYLDLSTVRFSPIRRRRQGKWQNQFSPRAWPMLKTTCTDLDVATRDGVVLFLHGATTRQEPLFCSLNVGHQELEDRSMLFALFDVEAESSISNPMSVSLVRPVDPARTRHEEDVVASLVGSDDHIVEIGKRSWHLGLLERQADWADPRPAPRATEELDRIRVSI